MEAVHELPLTRGYVALIDASAFERELYCELCDGYVWTGRICDLPWQSEVDDRTVYAKSTIRNNGRHYGLRLHRAVMLAGKGQIVDHRDGNGLHCWEGNLRVTNGEGNSRNRRKMTRPCTSQFKGVRLNKSSGSWLARIKVSQVEIHLGSFANEEDAGRAYDAAAIKHFGEYARLNFPIPNSTPSLASA